MTETNTEEPTSANELAEERTEKAEKRTDMANERTLLASERTFAGWARTSFASIALGLGLQALFKTVEPTWLAKSIATLFVVLGVVIIWGAERRAASLLAGEAESLVLPSKFFRFLAGVVSGGAVALIAVLWWWA